MSFTPNNPSSQTTGLPNAYMRYVLYDETGTRAIRSGRVFVTSAAHTSWEKLEFEYEVPENGLLQVYTANETDAQNVWFDDLKVDFTPQLIVQENHYYPFGLELAGITKGGIPEHKFKFTGVELTSDFDLQWYDYTYRKNYNPQVARFFSVDPIAEEYIYLTPYQHASNNPATNIELEGLEGVPAKGKNNKALKDPYFVPQLQQEAKRKTKGVLVRKFIGKAAKVGRQASPWSFVFLKGDTYEPPLPGDPPPTIAEREAANKKHDQIISGISDDQYSNSDAGLADKWGIDPAVVSQLGPQAKDVLKKSDPEKRTYIAKKGNFAGMPTLPAEGEKIEGRHLSARPVDSDPITDTEGNVTPNVFSPAGMSGSPVNGFANKHIQAKVTSGKWNSYSMTNKQLVQAGLLPNQDSATHVGIQPLFKTKKDNYQQNIRNTQPLWRKEAKPKK